MTNEFTLPARTKIEELKDLYCDSYKDVYGIKARWVYGQDLTEGELNNMLDRLEREYLAHKEEEDRREAQAELEARKQIRALIEHGAKNVVRAVRWMHDSYDTGGDNKYLDFELRVRYGFIDEVLEKGL
jgi:hypothetical protein